MNNNRLSALDRALQTGGAERMKSGFAALISSNRQKALRLLDDDKLRFPALFTVLPEIQAFKLTDGLNPKNSVAAAVCARKLGRAVTPDAGFTDSETLYQALRWMFDTGKSWEATGAARDGYEAVIDYVSALLVITFEDASVLPDIARLIFKRAKRGRLIHDLAWCFFQTLDYEALRYAAEQLLSPDTNDAALAAKLLGLETSVQDGRAGIKTLYDRYVEWLGENRPYLYVTGEHFQQSSRPIPLSVDNEAKYLGKELSPRFRAPVTPLNDHDIACLREYRGFPPEEQELLTDYSHRLRRSDARAWEAWMQKQVSEQVIAAISGYDAV